MNNFFFPFLFRCSSKLQTFLMDLYPSLERGGHEKKRGGRGDCRYNLTLNIPKLIVKGAPPMGIM